MKYRYLIKLSMGEGGEQPSLHKVARKAISLTKEQVWIKKVLAQNHIPAPPVVTPGNLQTAIIGLDTEMLRNIHDNIGAYRKPDESYGSIFAYNDIEGDEKVSNVHFLPFGKKNKIAGTETECIFLGCIDLLRYIKAQRAKDIKPDFIDGTTNPVMARIAHRKLNFSVHGGIININGNDKVVPPKELPQLVDDLATGKRELVANAEIQVGISIKAQELLNTAIEFKIQDLLAILYKSIRKKAKGFITPEEIASLERDIRKKAIVATAFPATT